MSSAWAQNSTLHASNILSCQNYTPKLKKNHGTEFSWVGLGTQRHNELSCSDNFHFRRGFLFGSATASSGPAPPHSRGFLITHNDTPQSVGLLRASDQLVAETST
jgi:hypothetical protein